MELYKKQHEEFYDFEKCHKIFQWEILDCGPEGCFIQKNSGEDCKSIQEKKIA